MKSRKSQQPLGGSYSNFKLKLIGTNQSVQKYELETTSNGRWPQIMKSRISQQPLVGSYSNLKLKLIGLNRSVQRYELKTTSNGKWPQNVNSRISQQLPVGSYSTFKLKLMGSNQSVQWKTTSNGRWPQIRKSKGEIRGKLCGNFECGSAQPSLFYSPNLYGGQAIARSGVQSSEHVYTECTDLFCSAQVRYPTYFARLQFFVSFVKHKSL
jgi:hypothetical protein